ncbi:MAG: hypothetical protein DMG40_09515 [Acidobacteria bacterium]|nr:MAG: hypothetical protein DMG40_09515 [Acidobacteriota bacterium]
MALAFFLGAAFFAAAFFGVGRAAGAGLGAGASSSGSSPTIAISSSSVSTISCDSPPSSSSSSSRDSSLSSSKLSFSKSIPSSPGGNLTTPLIHGSIFFCCFGRSSRRTPRPRAVVCYRTRWALSSSLGRSAQKISPRDECGHSSQTWQRMVSRQRPCKLL